jgi:signal transduction histidine kinase
MLSCLPARIELEVSDFGQGFDTEKKRVGGMGLNNMLARAEELGGTLTIQSKPGQGPTVRFIANLKNRDLDHTDKGTRMANEVENSDI